MARRYPAVFSVWMCFKGTFRTLFLSVFFMFAFSTFGSDLFAQCPDAPTGIPFQSFCSAASPTVADLTAVGTDINWYSVPSGGTALPTTTVLGNGNHYYATQTVGGCESSTRFDVTVTINSTPLAPSGPALQTFCSGTSPTINNLSVTGTAVQWYDAATGGSLLPLATPLGNGTHYYASQTVSGCESASRLDVTATVNISPIAPTGAAAQTFCSGTSARVSALTATGTAIRWYSAPSGGTALGAATPLVNGNHYYATQTVGGCESVARFDVTVTINATPLAPTGSASQIFCTVTTATVADLTATGTAIRWYLFSSGGSALPTTTVLGSGSHYYASQTVNGCESVLRLDVVATVNSVPVAPIGSSSQSFCNESLPTVADLVATGVGIQWYAAASGGTALPVTTALTDATQYFATQTQSGCESIDRFEVTATVTPSPAPPTGAAAQFFCEILSPAVADLAATGTAIQWYSTPTGGSPLADTDALTDATHYYATQTVGCESISRLDVLVTVSPTPPAPTGSPAQVFCSSDAPAIEDIVVTGTSILWYPVPVGGTPLAAGTLLGNGSHYYASQSVSGCESTLRFDVVVSINATPIAPTGSVSQSFCANTLPTVASLIVTGTAIQWYSAPSGGTALPSSTPLVNLTHYYASQTVAGCESTLRLDVTAIVNPDNTITLTSAAGTNSQTICIGSAIADITYSTTGPTGATFTGLPAGLTGTWLADVVTISGTPAAAGTSNYTVTLTGGCGVITATGTVTVDATNTLAMTSAAGTDAQTVCINTAIVAVTYSTTGATGATVTGLPAGVTGTWLADVVTISGTPTTAGPSAYTVTLTGGCGTITAAGTIAVTSDNTIALTSAAGTDAQTVCINTPVNNITYVTTGATGATVTGLPAGVAGVWLADAVTISGTPTASGPFTYTVTLTGGCGTITSTGTITVTPDNTVILTSAAGTDAQAVCINTPVINIAYSTTGATGATVTGLPAGVTATWLADVVTISGTPTAAGPSNYTVTLTGGCGVITTAGTINVNPDNTVALTSPAGTDAQTVCINTPVNNITYATTGATGATVTGLPAGVTGTWLGDVVTISGTPSVAGPTTYTVTLTGGCGVITTTGTINVNPDNTIALTSAAGTNAQTICIGSAIADITYSTTGATGATFTGLPAGLTGTWLADVVTISGTPAAAGTSNYTVTLTGGCGVITATGTVTVDATNTLAMTSAAGTDAQTVCINTAIVAVTYSTTGATGATVTGLPAGVTGTWLADVVTISGTPTTAGPSAYTVTLTGGCGTITATGTIDVTPDNTISLTSAAGTDAQTVCINTPVNNITYATTGATGATVTGLPAGVTGTWLADVVTISGTPTASGPFTYTITLTGGCGTITSTGTITVTPDNTVTLTSAAATDAQAVCINTPVINIAYSTTGATGATVTGLPAGVTSTWLADVVTISGTPTAAGPSNYTVTLTGGCGVITTAGTINVNDTPAVTATPTDILCNGAATGSATASPSGGTGTYTYSWNTTPVQTLITATGLAAGTYTVTVTDGNGCTASSDATISEPVSPLSGSITSQTNVPVPGGNTGSVTVTGAGGSSPYLFSLNSGAYQASGTFGSLTAGIYTVTVRDINLCTIDVPVTITEPSAVLSGAVSSPTNVACFGAATGSVTITGAGGVPPYDYSIDGIVFQSSGYFGNLVAGSYTVTVRDAGLITAVVPAVITEPLSATGGSITSQTDIVCAGTSTGAITAEGSGGTSPYQYRIGTGAYQASGTFTALAAGSHTVTVQDANLCTFDIPVVITEPAVALSFSSIATNVSCEGSANGQITVSGAGGTSPYNYSIDGGTYQSSGNFSNLDVATYTVSVQDANLCTATSSITITEPEQLLVSGAATDASCPEVPDGAITLSITGGTQPYNVIWSDGILTVDRTDVTGGTYSAVVADVNGCAASLTVVVGVVGTDRCLEIPDIITPNDDGYNDTWLIKNIDLFPQADVSVFNRWGKKVFATKNLAGNPWDGRYEGKLLPTDSYHYILNLNDGSKTRSGVISIIR